MIIPVQILCGLAIGLLGFRQMSESPVEGCCALFAAGFLILNGIENLLRAGEKNRRAVQPDGLP
jgi:hypothetical protein